MTPFLFQCAQHGAYFPRVQQSFGFCERSEILSGQTAMESGFFTAVGFDPANSEFRTSLLEKTLARLENTIGLMPVSQRFRGKARNRIRAFASRYYRKLGVTTPLWNIPFHWLENFALTEDLIDWTTSDRSLLSALGPQGKSYYYDAFTAIGRSSPFRTDSERLEGALAAAANQPRDFYLIYIASPDSLGHTYGPFSKELCSGLRELDANIQNFVGRLNSIQADNRFVFLGDHGMHKVAAVVNLQSELDRITKGDKKTVYFVDSTMIRVWNVPTHMRSLLKSSELFRRHGNWVSPQFAAEHGIPWPNRLYGDCLWVANPGTLVFPDFFRTTSPCKGMHGYDPRLPDSQGVCVHWGHAVGERKGDTILLADVFTILKKSLDL